MSKLRKVDKAIKKLEASHYADLSTLRAARAVKITLLWFLEKVIFPKNFLEGHSE